MEDKKIDVKKIRFSIIRHRGQPTEARLPDGRTVHRAPKLFFVEYGGFIPCAPYDDHFIYEMPRDIINVPSIVCTCGFPAAIVSYSGYIRDASPQGKLVVCLHHANYGIHATGGSKWV